MWVLGIEADTSDFVVLGNFNSSEPFRLFVGYCLALFFIMLIIFLGRSTSFSSDPTVSGRYS